MKVLLLNHNIKGRGTFQRCVDFARLLAAKGHCPTIVTNSKNRLFCFKSETEDGIQIVQSPDLFWGILRSGWDPINVIRRYLHLKNERFDIIHAFDNRPTVILPALWLRRKWDCPLVSDWCDWWGRGGAIAQRKHKLLNFLFSPIETFFEEHYRKHAVHLTVISHALKDRAAKLGFPEDKIDVIPPLVDIKKFFPMDKQKARQNLKLTACSHILIFSGFVLYDLDMVFESFRKVHEQYPKCLLILTGGVPGSETKRISDLPFLNLGFVSDEVLNEHLAASDLCLMPLADCLTNRARFPHKIGRYLAAGRPIVTNPIGDAGKLIAESGSGILTDSNPCAFAKGICDALKDETLLARQSLLARKTAENRLSDSVFSDKLDQIYQSCLTQKVCLNSNFQPRRFMVE